MARNRVQTTGCDGLLPAIGRPHSNRTACAVFPPAQAARCFPHTVERPLRHADTAVTTTVRCVIRTTDRTPLLFLHKRRRFIVMINDDRFYYNNNKLLNSLADEIATLLSSRPDSAMYVKKIL